MKKIVAWINKVWTHTRDETGDFGIRAFIHIPIGLFLSLPVFGWALTYLFWKYQKNEDGYYHDGAWKDVFGSMVGYVIGTAIQICVLRFVLF